MNDDPRTNFSPRAAHPPAPFWGPCAKKGGGGAVRSLALSFALGPTFAISRAFARSFPLRCRRRDLQRPTMGLSRSSVLRCSFFWYNLFGA
jgi:hypothetical protein